MTTAHELHTFYAGDDWLIRGTLYDADGDPVVLDQSVTIQWGLLDDDQDIIIDSDDVSIVVTDANAGKLEIRVSDLVTAGIQAGTYTDALRITSQSLSATMWVGPIRVKPNPLPPVGPSGTSTAVEATDVSVFVGTVT